MALVDGRNFPEFVAACDNENASLGRMWDRVSSLTTINDMKAALELLARHINSNKNALVAFRDLGVDGRSVNTDRYVKLVMECKGFFNLAGTDEQVIADAISAMGALLQHLGLPSLAPAEADSAMKLLREVRRELISVAALSRSRVSAAQQMLSSLVGRSNGGLPAPQMPEVIVVTALDMEPALPKLGSFSASGVVSAGNFDRVSDALNKWLQTAGTSQSIVSGKHTAVFSDFNVLRAEFVAFPDGIRKIAADAAADYTAQKFRNVELINIIATLQTGPATFAVPDPGPGAAYDTGAAMAAIGSLPPPFAEGLGELMQTEGEAIEVMGSVVDWLPSVGDYVLFHKDARDFFMSVVKKFEEFSNKALKENAVLSAAVRALNNMTLTLWNSINDLFERLAGGLTLLDSAVGEVSGALSLVQATMNASANASTDEVQAAKNEAAAASSRMAAEMALFKERTEAAADKKIGEADLLRQQAVGRERAFGEEAVRNASSWASKEAQLRDEITRLKSASKDAEDRRVKGLDDTARSLTAELKNERQRHSNELAALKAQHASELAQLKFDGAGTVAALRDSLSAEVKTLTAAVDTLTRSEAFYKTQNAELVAEADRLKKDLKALREAAPATEPRETRRPGAERDRSPRRDLDGRAELQSLRAKLTDQAKAAAAERAALEKDVKALRGRNQTLSKELEGLSIAVEDARRARPARQQSVTNSAEYVELKGKYKTVRGDVSKLEKSLAAERAQAAQREEDYTALKQKLVIAGEKLTSVSQELTLAKRTADEARLEAASILSSNDLNRLKYQTALREIDQYVATIEELQTELKKHEEANAADAIAFQALQDEKLELQRMLNKKDSEFDGLTTRFNLLLTAQKEAASRLQELETAKEELGVRQILLDEARDKLKELISASEIADGEIEDLRAAADLSDGTLVVLQQQLDEAFKNNEEFNAKIDDFRRDVAARDDTIKDLTRQVDEKSAKISELYNKNAVVGLGAQIDGTELETGIAELVTKFFTTVSFPEPPLEKLDTELDHLRRKLRVSAGTLQPLGDSLPPQAISLKRSRARGKTSPGKRMSDGSSFLAKSFNSKPPSNDPEDEEIDIDDIELH